MFAALALAGCEARNLDPDAGGSGSLAGLGGAGVGGAGAGAGGEGGPVCSGCVAPPLLSDFEDLAGATIVRYGDPPRNGFWYTSNDGSPSCTQTPAPGDPYVGEAPPTGVPNAEMGSLSLHGFWSGCTTWGAAIGADLNVPISTDGAIYVGPKRPYDLTDYAGLTFWARGEPGSEGHLRLEVPMRATTERENGGSCDEEIVGVGRCGDDWGEEFSLPANGSWKQFTIFFSDVPFFQEGWGAIVAWDAKEVTSIRIRSVTPGVTYDFWLDDMYLVRLR
jgi:hypothetical protein